MNRFEGKVALVTGAASGIGQATASRLIAEGATVAGIDVQRTGDWDDGTGALHVVDVRDEDAVAGVVEATVATHGCLDVLVTAAGVGGGGPAHLVELDDWERTVGINLTGTFLACKHALRAMLESRSGSIVTIASIEGLEGIEGGI